MKRRKNRHYRAFSSICNRPFTPWYMQYLCILSAPIAPFRNQIIIIDSNTAFKVFRFRHAHIASVGGGGRAAPTKEAYTARI